MNKRFAMSKGYGVYQRQTHVGFAYDITWPGKTGMDNSMYKTESEAWTAVFERLAIDMQRAKELLTTDNSRADALTDEQYETAARNASRLATQIPGSTFYNAAKFTCDEIRAILAASPVEQPAADEGRRILWGRSDYERLLDAMLRAQVQGWSGEHMTRAENMLGCYPHPNVKQPAAAPIPKLKPPKYHVDADGELVRGAAPSPTDERAAFEAFWKREMNVEEMDLHRCDYPMMPAHKQPYACHETNRAWMAWQARAAAASETGGGRLRQLALLSMRK